MKQKKTESQPPENLTWLEAVRKRPAMYVGSTGIYGFTHILKELFASFYKYFDPEDIAFKLHSYNLEADKISFEICGKQSGIFRIEKPKNKIPANISENLSSGFDFAVLNALSIDYKFRLFDKTSKLLLEQIYRRGILQSGVANSAEFAFETMEIEFTLDLAIWQEFEINPYFCAEIIKELAFLNEDKIFELKYALGGEKCRIIYQFPNGIKDLVSINSMSGHGSTIFPTDLKYQSENFSADICFAFRKYSVDEPFFKSFVNNHYTHEGGTHAKALLFGIGSALKKFIKEQKPDESFVITNRTILSSLIGVIHLKMKKPSFEGSIKNKLNNPQIIEPISEMIFKNLYEQLINDPKTAIDLIRHKFAEVHWNRKWL